MTWQLPALIACFSWGFATILLRKGMQGQAESLTLLFYNGAIFATTLLGFIWRYSAADNMTARIPNLSITVAAGVCSGLAVLSQMYAFERHPAHIPWTVLVGGLYPAVVIGFLLFTGMRPTSMQWAGIFFGLLAIICLGMPSGK